MNATMCRSSTVFVILVVLSEILANKIEPYDMEEDLQEIDSFASTTGSDEEEYIRHIHSMFDAYRGERTVIETNALIDTKYRTWKRNADLINSLLALPKGMNDAGR